METNNTGGTNDRTGNVNNKREIAVDRNASEAEIQAKKMKNEYNFEFVAVDMAPTKNNMVEIDGSNNASGDTTNTGRKTSKHLIVGNTMIMRFKEKIQDIINGVSLKVKGEKDKTEKSTEKKSATVKRKTDDTKANRIDEK